MILNKKRIKNTFAKAEKIFKIIIELINHGFVKKDNRFFFTSYPDFSDSPHSLWKYLDSSEKKIEIVWSVNDSSLFQSKNYQNTIFVTKFSFEYFYYLFTSRVTFFTHGIPLGASKSQINIYVGHLIAPIKKWGIFEDRYSETKHLAEMNKYVHSYLSNSEFSKKIMTKCMGTIPKKVKVTGLPRNDKLTINNKNFTKKQLKLSETDVKNIIYMPTFRKEKFDVKQTINQLQKNKKLNEFLTRKKSKFLIKLHPYDEANINEKQIINSNFKILKSNLLSENNVKNNDIYECVDLMITDYSSSYMDFLPFKKPIIFFCPDYETYKESRGFMVNPMSSWLPGPIYYTELDLIGGILNHKKIFDQERHEEIKNIFHNYSDNRNCERVINHLQEIISKN